MFQSYQIMYLYFPKAQFFMLEYDFPAVYLNITKPLASAYPCVIRSLVQKYHGGVSASDEGGTAHFIGMTMIEIGENWTCV